MSGKLLRFLFITACFLLSSGKTFAHHGDAGRYAENVTTVTGTVVELRFINPHVFIVVDVKDESGNVERWQGELGSANQLHRTFGWTKDTLKPGDRITMVGRRLRNGSNYIGLNEKSKVILADSAEEIFHGGGGQQAPQAP
jgi:hypothetical protein